MDALLVFDTCILLAQSVYRESGEGMFTHSGCVWGGGEVVDQFLVKGAP